MPLTKDALYRSVLQELVALGVGEVPSADDVAVVKLHTDARIDELMASGDAYISSLDAIDEFALRPLTVLGRNASAAAFGQEFNRDSEDRATATLRKMYGAGRQASSILKPARPGFY